jgi:amidase
MSAVEMTRRIRAKDLAARDAMAAHLNRIAQINPRLNAIVTLDADRAMARAADADERLARGQPPGPLHGLPVAHKDLLLTRGMRTTFGSPILKDFVPSEDSLIVERLRSAGAIAVGKTNTPEFGAGSQTFNPVFGATLNPYDETRTCGGSSGGAAVALATGMLPIADGTDMGGSLRNPASFCGVVGLRPSPGRVPSWPAADAWSTLSVDGPMARTVSDVALMLSAIAGPDARSPIALEAPGASFAAPLARDFRGVRVAWWTELGGAPVDRRVRSVVNGQRAAFEALGCEVVDAEPDFAGFDEVFKVIRALAFLTSVAPRIGDRRDLVKAPILWEIDRGARLTPAEITMALNRRTELFHRMRQFMDRHEFFVLPTVQVPPFSVDQPYPTEIDGVKMETYIDWMRSCYFISIVSTPAISVPCGFTDDGLPIGLQIVGRHGDDFGVLQIAHGYERARGVLGAEGTEGTEGTGSKRRNGETEGTEGMRTTDGWLSQPSR